MARQRKILLALFVLVLIAAAGYGGHRYYKAWQEEQFLTTAPETPGREILFRVEPGQIFSTISQNLKQAGLVADTRRFLKLAVETGATTAIRAGKFRLNTGWTPGEILHELTTSSGIMKKVVVREGLTWWQTADKIHEAGLGTREAFAAVVSDPDLLAAHGIQADNAEGYLFPETYLLTPPREDQSRYMAETMLAEFFKNARTVWPDGLPEWAELNRMVIIASLVEKETGDVTERERISGVFHIGIRHGRIFP